MRTKAPAAILATLATLAIIGPASAAPMHGDASSDEAAAERQFFVRRTGCTADQRLSIERGTETSGCADNFSHTPINEVNRTPVTYAAENGVPFTLDASRPAKGVVSLTSFQQPAYAGAGQTIVDVALQGTSGGQSVSLGSTTVEYVAIPGQPPKLTPWSISLPAGADNKSFSALTLSLTVRGVHITHGYVRPNETNLTLPIHPAE